MDHQPHPPYLKFKEFTLRSGLSESTIRRRVRDGSLPAIQVGGKGKKLLFAENALEQTSNRMPAATSDSAVVSSPCSMPPEISAERGSGPRPQWMKKLIRKSK